jgi:hypothetical protein
MEVRVPPDVVDTIPEGDVARNLKAPLLDFAVCPA